MRGKKEQLADLLFNTRLIEILCRFTAHNKVVVLNYHRIRPDSATAATPFDDGVFTVKADQFSQQMNWLKRHTRILSENELIDQITTNNYQKSKCPSVVITFDDGYQDHYSIAYPILRSLQIPATFFITTEIIGERKLYWWDVVAYLIKKCRKPSIVINGHEYTLQNNRLKIIADIQRQMKGHSRERIRHHIRFISEAAEMDLPSDELQDRELLTQDQIREMAEHHMTMGSHTHSHQALSCLADREHEAELMVSKELLEQTTGQAVQSVAYPFGIYQFVPPSIQDTARKCGYRLGFMSSLGVNYHNQINDMALDRVSGELGKVSTTALITVWPELFTSKEGNLPNG